MPTETPAKLSISMPPRMAKKLQSAAKRADMTVSEFIRSLLRGHLENQKTK
jgi:metal-responsive CopG/Arc/MetJ family transcriptional regulator